MGRMGSARARRVGMGAVALAVLVLAGCYTDKGVVPGFDNGSPLDVAADGTVLAAASNITTAAPTAPVPSQ